LSKVSEVMSRDCVTVGMDESIQQIAVKMKEHDIGFMPILEGRKLVGVVTDRDLAIRGYANNHPGSSPIRNMISSDVSTISPNASIDEAAKLMAKEQIRRLPVVENGELVGVLAIGDLAVRDRFDDEAGEALSRISEQF